ncbi:hypothetical protein NO098_350087 [Flavobacterium psychrophilum]|nr:hypothetical protein NO098_350087 [Flavobacterium psychrophilum]
MLQVNPKFFNFYKKRCEYLYMKDFKTFNFMPFELYYDIKNAPKRSV